ncbi:hypothetical protein AAF712_002953 [Marasmius tenuissimus]|uniref:Uncharacterized protein n=1 Tax=Marasmius tenuissimus TaxID=585030 RepID=A0ABR3A7T8_9AGAR
MSSTPSSASSTTSSRSGSGVAPKRSPLSSFLACFTVSPTLDMYDFSMLQSQMEESPTHTYAHTPTSTSPTTPNTPPPETIRMRKMTGSQTVRHQRTDSIPTELRSTSVKKRSSLYLW